MSHNAEHSQLPDANCSIGEFHIASPLSPEIVHHSHKLSKCIFCNIFCSNVLCMYYVQTPFLTVIVLYSVQMINKHWANYEWQIIVYGRRVVLVISIEFQYNCFRSEILDKSSQPASSQ